MSEAPTEAAPATEEAVPANGDAALDEAPRLVDRLGGFILQWARPLLAVFGLGGFIVGIVVAWRSESATALLIVSAVLIVLAVLGLDWSKIRGTYGGLSFEVLRYLGGRVEEVAASDEASPAIREELEALRAEVEALTPRKRPPPSMPPANTPALGSEGWRDLFRTRATHAFRGTDAVQLTIRAGATNTMRYRCTVKTPTGATYQALTRGQVVPYIGLPMPYVVDYPDEFEGSEPLTPGRYDVEWRAAPFIDPADQAAGVYSALAQAVGTPLATDSFTIPARGVAGAEEPEPPAAG